MKTSYFFAGLGFVSAIGSMILAIASGTSWIWQFNCAIWVGVAFLNDKMYNNLSKHVKDLTDHLVDQTHKPGRDA